MLKREVPAIIYLVEHTCIDAAQSLSFDDQLLERGCDCFSVRINDPCVSVGFNQEIQAEVDISLAKTLGIAVVRRKTGGGAVYRDRGCVSYSFIVPTSCRDLPIEIVIEALSAMGVEVERTGRNDLFWNGRKVSGYAWSERGQHVLVHGTLLFSTDLDVMSALLDRGKPKYRDTAIASARARVINLQPLFPELSAEVFRCVLQQRIVHQLEQQGIEIINGVPDTYIMGNQEEKRGEMTTSRGLPKVAFVCTHNACRSQLAEALARAVASNEFEAYSAGTHPVANVDAVALHLLEKRGIDISVLQPKTLFDIPSVDYVITMGCGVACPSLPCTYREDWNLEDPTGQSVEKYEMCIETIEGNIEKLRQRIMENKMSNRWYPVIDYDLCQECGSCTEKCKRGVFDKARAPHPVVILPNECKEGCRGCAEICPTEAITYVGDNGDIQYL
jgi:lipoate---protein ligase